MLGVESDHHICMGNTVDGVKWRWGERGDLSDLTSPCFSTRTMRLGDLHTYFSGGEGGGGG